MSQITKPIALDETLAATNVKLQGIIDRLGKVDSINGRTGAIWITFPAVTVTPISGSDYMMVCTAGSIS